MGKGLPPIGAKGMHASYEPVTSNGRACRLRAGGVSEWYHPVLIEQPFDNGAHAPSQEISSARFCTASSGVSHCQDAKQMGTGDL